MEKLTLSNIEKLDKANMLDLLISFPVQIKDALSIARKVSISKFYKRHYENLVFTGLGGSAIGADVIKGYVLDQIDIPIVVNRTYTLPKFAGKTSLLFCISYSGNTEETLAAYKEGKRRKISTIVITSGGKLKNLALKNKDLVITIPAGYPPRCALGYSFVPALVTLGKLGLIKRNEKEIEKVSKFLSSLERNKLNPKISGKKNISKEIAKKINKRFPIFYADSKLESLATRWRGQVSENSKTLASTHLFPEMNHNEIVGWVYPRGLLKNFIAVILKDKDDHPRVKLRMNITNAILKKEGFKTLTLDALGKSSLERMLSLIYIGDFVSFYLSILNGVDPTPVKRIDYLKKQLKAQK